MKEIQELNQIENNDIDQIHLNIEERRFYDREKKEFSPIPKRIVLLCVFLMVTGSTFFITGMVDYWHGDPERGLAFVILGCFLSIPGYFYGYHLYLAYTAHSPDEREEILNEIPNYQ